MKTKELVLEQLDRQLENSKLKELSRPKYGWVRTIRKALGMTGEQLAKRLGVSRSRVIRIEEDEQRDAVTLRTLKDVAEAFNCKLVYALVPKDSLQSILKNQAGKVAKQRMQRVSHTMRLENQGIEESQQQTAEERLIEVLLSGSLKHLWEKK